MVKIYGVVAIDLSRFISVIRECGPGLNMVVVRLEISGGYFDEIIPVETEVEAMALLQNIVDDANQYNVFIE